MKPPPPRRSPAPATLALLASISSLACAGAVGPGDAAARDAVAADVAATDVAATGADAVDAVTGADAAPTRDVTPSRDAAPDAPAGTCPTPMGSTAIPSVGFELGGAPAVPSAATVLSVDDTGADLLFAGNTLRFHWPGRLALVVGSSVEIWSEGGWDTVRGAGVASAFHDRGFVASEGPFPVTALPGATMRFVRQCDFAGDTMGACGQPARLSQLFSVEVSLSGRRETIPVGGAASVGGNFRNHMAVQRPGYGDGMCVLEADWGAALTLESPGD